MTKAALGPASRAGGGRGTELPGRGRGRQRCPRAGTERTAPAPLRTARGTRPTPCQVI